MTTKAYKLFLVEAHPLLRQALRHLLEKEPNLEIIGEAVSAEDALSQLANLKPQLLLVNLSLPGMSGLELIKHLRLERPELRCLVVSGHDNDYYRQAALAAGAWGFVSKDEPGLIVGAVQKALHGVVRQAGVMEE